MTRKTQSRGQEGRHPQPAATPDSEIRIVHSSDIHVDTDYNAHLHGGDGTKGLASVLDTAHHLGADVVVLAGDVFENNRLPLDVLNRTADLLRDFDRPVVILPGNHDPAVPESAHHRGGFADLANVSVLGITHAKAVRFAALDLEIWGRAHLDYDDMAPLAQARPRRTGWQIAVAHGHYEPTPDLTTPYRPSWLISAAELAASGADYVALGHWNRPVRVGRTAVKAYYSGCPELAKTVNLVRLAPSGTTVSRKAIRWR
jgi:DNA repair exonuclease SbcCD nuclease subunit